MRELSFLNKGITITLQDRRDAERTEEGELITETFYSTAGLTEFVKYIDKSRVQLIPDIIYFEGEKKRHSC